MKSAVLVLAAAAGTVVAQNFGGEPSCAIPCLTSAISAVGCKIDDQACQCGPSQAAIGAKVIGCFATACSPSDIGVAASVGSSLCAAFSKTAGSGTVVSTVTSTSTTAAATSTSVTVVSTTSSASGTLITPPPTTSNGTFSTSGPTSSKTSTATNAAATAGAFGFGAVAALLGAVAAL